MIKLTPKQEKRLGSALEAVSDIFKKQMVECSNKQVVIKTSFNCGGIRSIEESTQTTRKIDF